MNKKILRFDEFEDEKFEWECIVHAQKKQAEISRINALEIAFGNIIEKDYD
jgi:hypothetical protein